MKRFHMFQCSNAQQVHHHLIQYIRFRITPDWKSMISRIFFFDSCITCNIHNEIIERNAMLIWQWHRLDRKCERENILKSNRFDWELKACFIQLFYYCDFKILMLFPYPLIWAYPLLLLQKFCHYSPIAVESKCCMINASLIT